MKDMNYFSKIILFSLLAIFLSNDMYSQCFAEQTYSSPGEHTFTIPGTSGESYLIEVEVRGADGGDFLWGGNPQSDGGEGATLKASFNVNGADELFIIVGESGFDAIGSPGGGGGGGGSAVILNSTDVLIAAAAGGGGGQATVGQGGLANTNSPAGGGPGPGASGGGGFNEDGVDGAAGSGGGAGTLTSQGSGGTQGVVAGPGGSGFGGGGGGSGTGGGGGGGYLGGSGAESGNLNGKGGDSFVNAGFGSTIIFNNNGITGGGNNFDGNVVITCIPTSGINIIVEEELDPPCANLPFGSIEVSGSGGVLPYSYSIDGGPFGPDGLFENLGEGTYLLTVMDGTSATASTTVTLVDPPELELNVISVADNQCFGASEGSIEISGSGGTSASGDYMYTIDGVNYQSSGFFDGLASGDYNLNVIDDNGCLTEVDVTVGSIDEIMIVTEVTDESCENIGNGAVTVLASGGFEGFSYSLNDGPPQSSNMFSSLFSGEFTLTVIDAIGCEAEHIFTVGFDPSLTLSIASLTGVSCEGADDGAVVVEAMGGNGYMYSIDGVNFQDTGEFSNLVVGNYTVTVVDDVSCTQTIDFTIGEGEPFSIELILTDPTCVSGTDGTIEVTSNQSMMSHTYVLNDGDVQSENIFEELSAGFYEVLATNPAGCESVASGSLNDPAMIVIMTTTTDASCTTNSDGSIVIDVTGGAAPYLYQLDGDDIGSNTFMDLAPGIYNVLVTDANGCTAMSSATIGAPDPILITIESTTNAGCNGDTSGAVTLASENAQGEVTYMINGVNNTTGIFEGLEAGDYIATAVDDNGCASTLAVTIPQNNDLTLTSILTDVNCAGENSGSIVSIADGGVEPYTYSINEGMMQESGEFESLSADTYVITAFDSQGCFFSSSLTIGEPDKLTLVEDSLSHISCAGADDGSITFHIEGGTADYTLTSQGTELVISDNEPLTFDAIAAGDYIYNIIDAAGCETTDTITFTTPDSLLFSDFEVAPANCETGELGSATITAIGGTPPYTYTIDGEPFDGTIMEQIGGEYQVAAMDDNGCLITSVLTIPQVGGFEVDTVIVNDISCHGEDDGMVTIMINGGNDGYLFSLNGITSEDGSYVNLPPGDYQLDIANSTQGCIQEFEITISETDMLSLAIDDAMVDTGSGDGFITVVAEGGAAPYMYSIDVGVTFQDERTFDNLMNDNYEVIVIDANGCMSEITFALTDIEELLNEINSVYLAPNPALESFVIFVDIERSASLTISMIDVSGKVVYFENLEYIYAGQHEIKVDRNDIPSGLYLVKVSTGSSTLYERIVIE